MSPLLPSVEPKSSYNESQFISCETQLTFEEPQLPSLSHSLPMIEPKSVLQLSAILELLPVSDKQLFL